MKSYILAAALSALFATGASAATFSDVAYGDKGNLAEEPTPEPLLIGAPVITFLKAAFASDK